MFQELDNRVTDGLEGAKWLAIVLMACSHSGMALGSEWLWPAFWIGRVCAPITGATALSGIAGTDSLATSFAAGDSITVNGTPITFVASGASGKTVA